MIYLWGWLSTIVLIQGLCSGTSTNWVDCPLRVILPLKWQCETKLDKIPPSALLMSICVLWACRSGDKAMFLSQRPSQNIVTLPKLHLWHLQLPREQPTVHPIWWEHHWPNAKAFLRWAEFHQHRHVKRRPWIQGGQQKLNQDLNIY